MKIERISDNQIRCTLEKADLDEMDIKFSELAYGTEKAKALFRDMVEQAHDEFGFEVDNSPLMVEAIPVGDSQLVLVITRVDDPEELDSRFSRFSKNPADTEQSQENNDVEEIRIEGSIPLLEGEEATENLMGLIKGIINQKISELGKKNPDQKKTTDSDRVDVSNEKIVVFSFVSMEDVMKVADMVRDFYDSTNTLYKNKKDKRYYLYVSANRNSQTEFMKLCNVMSEFGTICRTSYSTLDYFDEHFTLILKDDALQTLTEL